MIKEAHLDFWIQNNYNVLFVGKAGVGKCLGRGTPVLMFDGTIRNVEKVEAGDLLMGPDSRSRKVISICSGIDKLYEVSPIKGDKYIVNSAHILSLKAGYKYSKSVEKDEIINVNVEDFLSKSNKFKRDNLGYRVGVEFKEQEVPIDPYFIGIWLGDGTSTKVEITNGEVEISNFLNKFVENISENLYVEEKFNSKNSNRYNITTGKKRGQIRAGRNQVRNIMEELNLFGNKHIPYIYKVNSRDIRLALLAGIIDTDGSKSNNCYDIIQKNKTLVDDILFVARSLGLAAYSHECEKSCIHNGEIKKGKYYRITISGNTNEIPVKILYKKCEPRQQIKDVLKTQLNVREIGEGEYFGFEIDGDGLFLLGDFTATHNTSIVKSAFDRAHLNWKYFSASTMDPWVDLVGVPREKQDENGNTYLDLLRPKEFQDDTIEAIFMDEYNRSHKKIRNAVMELIQFKSINGKKYNNLRIVWAAINPADDEDEEYDVEKLDPAQEDRFHIKVDIPYTPDVKYFTDKFGRMSAKASIEWWKGLPKPLQNKVSPRRLDYALDIYSKGGDLNYVLPHGANIGKLIQGLANGPMQDKLQELFVADNKAKAEEFIKIENNYSSAIDFILKNKDFTKFFIPLLEKEKISSLLAANFKKKIKNGFIEYIVSHSKDCPIFKNVVNDVIKSNTNKELVKSLLKEISTNNLKNTYGIVSLPKMNNTQERMKALLDLEKSIQLLIKSNTAQEKDFEDSLKIIESILSHCHPTTVRGNPFITKMIKLCIYRTSYPNDTIKVSKMFPNIAKKCKL